MTFEKAKQELISAYEKRLQDKKSKTYKKHAEECVKLVNKAEADLERMIEEGVLECPPEAGSHIPCYLVGQIFEYLCRPIGSSLGLQLRSAGEVDCFVSIDGMPVSVECKVQGGDIEAILARYEAGLKPRTKYVVYFSRYTSKRKTLHAPVIIPTEEFAEFILRSGAYRISNGNNAGHRVCQPLVSAYDFLVSAYPVFTPFAKTSERMKGLTIKDLTNEEKAWLRLLFACYSK